jgi:type IV pilus assembly protein PilF
MENKLVVLLLVFIAIACSSGQELASKNKKADIHYSYGTQALIEKNYTSAISHLIQAAELDPKNPEIQNNLGMAYYFKGDKEMALKHIRLALEISPANTDALVNLASLAFERGDMAGAEKYYLRALKDLGYEKHARTYYNLSLIELRRKNNSKALALLDSSLKEEENYCPAWFQKGMISYQLRRFKDAQKNFHQAQLGVCVNDPAPLYWHAATEIELGNYLNARMKLDDLMTRFGTTDYGAMAQQKISELNLLENNPAINSRRSSSQLNMTPSF